MNKTIIAASVLIIIAAVAILLLPMPIQQTGSSGNEQEVTVEDSVQVEQQTVDEQYMLEDLYLEMLSEEMDSLDIEQTDYNEEMQNSMAEDLSQFYYE